MRRLLSSAGVLLLAATALARDCERIVAIGDLHGGIDAARTMLDRTGLVDDAGMWIGGKSCLVQLGDLVDRGPRSRELLDLFIDLNRQAPDRVFVILGNHEVMNLVGDLRYVAAGEFEAYRDLTPEGARLRLYESIREAGNEVSLSWFDRNYPPGYVGHRAAFHYDGAYGHWLRTRPTAVRLDDALFIHAGVDPDLLWNDVNSLNDEATEELFTFLKDRERLVERGWFDDFLSFQDSVRMVERRVARMLKKRQRDRDLKVAQRFVRFAKEGWLTRADGPMWTRALATGEEREIAPAVRAFQRATGVRQIVVGHTPQSDGLIRERLGGKIFLADTGAGPAYDGSPSALELFPDGAAYAAYPASRKLVWKPSEDDAEIERYLAEAEVIEMEEIGIGVTKPKRLRLDRDGDLRKAAFKYVALKEEGYTRMSRGDNVLHFTDSYLYERAAYIIDRELGMEMTPVAVIRKIGDDEGAVIEWIEGAIPATDVFEGRVDPPDPVEYERQQDIRRLFDALVANTDRNQGNMLVRTRDWKLFLIDHSRTFRYETELLESFTDRPARLPRALYERLGTLDEKRLGKLLRGLVPRPRVKAMFKRLEKILEKIEADREKYGDERTFVEPPVEAMPTGNPELVSLRADLGASR